MKASRSIAIDVDYGQDILYFYVMKTSDNTSLETRDNIDGSLSVMGSGGGFGRGWQRKSTIKCNGTNDVFRLGLASLEVRKAKLPIDGRSIHKSAVVRWFTSKKHQRTHQESRCHGFIS